LGEKAREASEQKQKEWAREEKISGELVRGRRYGKCPSVITGSRENGVGSTTRPGKKRNVL